MDDALSASPLADRAAMLLRADILACRLAPGATLSEIALAARTGLGRAPHPRRTLPPRR